VSAGLAQRVRELDVGVFDDVLLDPSPDLVVVADALAVHADGNQSL
jgi:hypothetical protein